MFGYVKPLRGELKVKENDFYKAVYCGLCRCMGSRVGCLHSLSLSYDFVFLALLLFALNDTPLSLNKGRCAAHPLKKTVYVESNPSLETASDLSALLLYYNLKDDMADFRFFKRFACLLALPFVSGMKRRVKGREEEESAIRRCLDRLAQMEKERIPSADEPAECFGELLSALLVSCLEDETKKIVAGEIAFHTGKWLYMADAADDLTADAESGNYNPFLAAYGSLEEAKAHRETIRTALLCEIDRIALALDFLDARDDGIKSILENIITYGMPNESERILKQEND